MADFLATLVTRSQGRLDSVRPRRPSPFETVPGSRGGVRVADAAAWLWPDPAAPAMSSPPVPSLDDQPTASPPADTPPIVAATAPVAPVPEPPASAADRPRFDQAESHVLHLPGDPEPWHRDLAPPSAPAHDSLRSMAAARGDRRREPVEPRPPASPRPDTGAESPVAPSRTESPITLRQAAAAVAQPAAHGRQPGEAPLLMTEPTDGDPGRRVAPFPAAAAPAPQVTVAIGRVEVKAAPAIEPVRRPPPPVRPRLSLTEYLARPRRGRR